MEDELELTIMVNHKEFHDIESYERYMQGQYYFDLKEIMQNNYERVLNYIAEEFDKRAKDTTDMDFGVHIGRDGCYVHAHQENNNLFEEYLDNEL